MPTWRRRWVRAGGPWWSTWKNCGARESAKHSQPGISTGRVRSRSARAFWPYERPLAQGKPRSLADYTAHIHGLLVGRACVKISFSPADEKLAAAFFERQVPIEIIEHGILMACTRKYMTLLTTPNSGLIVSLSYFKDAIEEAAASKVSNDYLAVPAP